MNRTPLPARLIGPIVDHLSVIADAIEIARRSLDDANELLLAEVLTTPTHEEEDADARVI
ncbi:MAG: hypothetical protein ABR509_04915 [Candidatus Limnocylindria bacterium]